MLGRTSCLSRLVFVTVPLSASTIKSSLSRALSKTNCSDLRWAIKMDPVNFRAVNSGLTRRWWALEISQGWGQCTFTELPWKTAEPKGVSLDLALSLTTYQARISQTHPLLGSSFVFQTNVLIIMNLWLISQLVNAGLLKHSNPPAWKHPWHLWTAGVCLSASSLLHSSWERRMKRIQSAFIQEHSFTL